VAKFHTHLNCWLGNVLRKVCTPLRRTGERYALFKTSYCQCAAMLYENFSPSPPPAYRQHTINMRHESKVVDRSLAIEQVMYTTNIRNNYIPK